MWGRKNKYPLCKGHQHYMATLALLEWGPYKRGPNVLDNTKHYSVVFI